VQVVPSDEISSSIEEMGKSIQGVAGNAEQLQKSANETSKVVENMAASISQVAQNARM